MRPSGKPENTVTASARVKPSVLRDLDRLAKRREENRSSYIANVLAAHVHRLVHCDVCEYDHPVHPAGAK